MKFSAVLLFLPILLKCQHHVSAGLTFGTSGYFPEGKLCGSHYTFDLVLRTWHEANAYCRSLGGNLVSIETTGEHEYLKGVIVKNNQDPSLKEHISKDGWFGFWTSGSDSASEGKYVWTANGMPVTLKHWNHGEPNDHKNNEDVLQIYARNGLWNDISGNYRMFSICEF